MSKPKTTEEWQAWCDRWDSANHQEKLAIAEEYGISYDSVRHWRSDCPVPTMKETGVCPKPMRITVEQLLGMRPAVNLDFASFDLETSNLKADFSIILSAVIKPFGQEPIVFRADNYPTWEKNRGDDAQITKDIAEELRKHAIIITHYGVYFDIPFLRAKMVRHGLEPLPQMFAIDSWQIARKNFQVSSRRLKNLARFFRIGEKEQVEGDLWVAAAYDGDRKAMDAIVQHNCVDCEVLEKLACISFAYLKSIPKL